MTLDRVVITGRGAVSPFGHGVSSLVEGVWEGRSAVRLIPDWQTIQGLTSHIAAPVPELNVKKLLPRTMRRTMGPLSVYATLAAMEAVEEAGLSREVVTSGEVGVCIGSTTGSPSAIRDFYGKYLPKRALEHIKSGEFFKIMGHSCAANVSLVLGIQGEQWAPVSACTSSSQALGLGYLLVRSGRQRAVLCGGADEVHESVTGIFDLLRAASNSNGDPENGCRPFDAARNGVVCGGGSGVMVLESLASAEARGAKIYAEITGFGNVTDSTHIANPDKVSMARAMQKAMQEGGVTADTIDYVNAHATGTELGDIAEALAIGEVVGATIPISSFKGHIGHTLGAAGGLELIVLLEMLERQEIIPTRNLNEVDPRCGDVNVVMKKQQARLATVLKNNFALGGVNTSLVLRRLHI